MLENALCLLPVCHVKRRPSTICGTPLSPRISRKQVWRETRQRPPPPPPRPPRHPTESSLHRRWHRNEPTGRNYAAVTAAALAASRRTKAGGRQASKISQANCKLQATATDHILPADTADHSSSTPTPVTATTTNAARAIIASTSTSPATGAQQSSRQQRLLRENRRPRGSVRHLAVFEGLGKGISAPLTISPPPMAELAGEKNELIPFGFGSACSSIPGFAVMVEDCCRAVGI